MLGQSLLSNFCLHIHTLKPLSWKDYPFEALKSMFLLSLGKMNNELFFMLYFKSFLCVTTFNSKKYCELTSAAMLNVKLNLVVYSKNIPALSVLQSTL